MTELNEFNLTETQQPPQEEYVTVTVPVDAMDDLIGLFGVFDENLRVIEEETNPCNGRRRSHSRRTRGCGSHGFCD